MAIRHFIAAAEQAEGSAAASGSRRHFLKISGAASAGLMVGFWSVPDTLLAADKVPPPYRANAFVTIDTDDSVTLTMAKIEMGQGTYTSLPMLIAEELEVDLHRVGVRHAPPDAKTYGIPYGDQYTGGSTSIRTMWEPMRQAGAAARMLLIQAAAEGWKVAPESCHAERGEVVHTASGRRIKYGKLVARASQLPLPVKIPLKPPAEFKVIGKPVKRFDAKGKVDGSAKFGIDTVLPGMKFAAVAASPVFGGRLKSVDETKARALPGVRDVVRLDNAVAVIADNTWYARQGVAALEIVWDDGANAKLSTDDIRKLMLDTLKMPGVIARNDGDALNMIAADGKRVEATYLNQMLAHATMEPMNCTVHVRPDSAEIWSGTQVPARARDSAAMLLGLPPEKVTLNNFLLGGGFGRRLYHDQIDQAVLIGKQVKGPVKVTWTREEDMQHDVYRGVYAHSVSASIGADGYPVALVHRVAGPSNLAVFAPAAIGPDGVDAEAADGSSNLSYGIANMRSEQTREEGPVFSGFWRGVGPTRNAPVLESFIDELAVKAGRDPLAYRLGMLGKNERARQVLTRAAQQAGWGGSLPARRGRGIALLYAFETYLAQVVELSVDAAGKVKVHRVVCAVDCGMVVNPDTVVAQMQSGINFGLTAALYGEITIKNGRVEQSNFHDYPMLRINEAPKIEVDLVQSGEAPGGIGEPGTSVVLAAFVNAIHAATGKRLYTLPAKPELLAVSRAS